MADILETLIALDNSVRVDIDGMMPTTEAEYNERVKFVSSTNEDGTVVYSETQPFTWSQVQTKKTELENAEPLKRLRLGRDNRMKECDWTQSPDSPLTAEKKTEWATYRQALRDLPSNYTTSDSQSLSSDLSNLVWPTKPE